MTYLGLATLVIGLMVGTEIPGWNLVLVLTIVLGGLMFVKEVEDYSTHHAH